MSNNKDNNEPLISLDENGQASVISYNVPEPTSYYSYNPIKLSYGKDYFQGHCFELTESEESEQEQDSDSLLSGIMTFFESGFIPPILDNKVTGLDSLKDISDSLLEKNVQISIKDWQDIIENNGKNIPTSNIPNLPNLGFGNSGNLSESIKSSLKDSFMNRLKEYQQENGKITISQAELLAYSIALIILNGQRAVIKRRMSGEVYVHPVSDISEAKPALYLIETRRISTYLGNYGAGRIIKTFSLLPGESTSISISTYKKSSSTSSLTSSILESYSEEASNEFEESINQEKSVEQERNEESEYYVDTSTSGSGNIYMFEVEAEVSAGISGSVETSRKEQSKVVTNAVNKQASKASSSRDIEINTSYENTTEEGEETVITREIENINLSRTLNFVFRQMNQEFYTFVHLVDIKIGYFNGDSSTKMEVPIHKLQHLVERVIAEDKQEEVKNNIEYLLSNIYDYKGSKVSDFVIKNSYEEPDGSESEFLAINTDKVTEYESASTGTSFLIPGVIIDMTTNVMRTEGIMVEAVLGRGEALDDYNQGLQDQKVIAEQLSNQKTEIENNQEKLKQKMVSNENMEAAEVYRKLYYDNCNSEEA